MGPIYTLLDLFAGCGGLTQGFVGTGRFRSLGAVELDRDAAATYSANFGPHVYQGDIADWLLDEEVPRADVVIGGPPCQGFSRLGRRWNRDPRNALWNRYVETIERVRPYMFILENVPDFLESGQFKGLRHATRPSGKLAAYRLHADVLDASEYGVPQRRKRAVVIGRLEEMPNPGIPERTTARSPMTVRGVFRERNVPLHVEAIRLPRLRGPYTTRELHLTRNVTELSRNRFAEIPEGGNRFSLPDHLKAPCWLKHTSGSADVMGRLHWDQPSVTIRTEFYKPEKGRYLHPTENRPITHYEAAVLQGFPDDFLWHGSKTSIGRQIGNAVPVALAYALAKQTANFLDRWAYQSPSVVDVTPADYPSEVVVA